MVPRQVPAASAMMDFLRYLSRGNGLQVVRFHEIGGLKAIDAMQNRLDEGLRLVQAQQRLTLSAVDRLLKVVAPKEDGGGNNETEDAPRPRLLMQ